MNRVYFCINKMSVNLCESSGVYCVVGFFVVIFQLYLILKDC